MQYYQLKVRICIFHDMIYCLEVSGIFLSPSQASKAQCVVAKMNCRIAVIFLTFLLLMDYLPASVAEEGEANIQEEDLQETSAEAIGDRIMAEMNGMKEKFDVALTRIGEEISKDEVEQNEMNGKVKK